MVRHLECPVPTQAQDRLGENQWCEGIDANEEQANHQGGNSPNCALQNADPGEASPGGNQRVPRRIGVNADYGVISLFDGVSTGLPTLQKKLGYPPTVIVLAEIDVSLRALVCAEFGYRPDQTWGRTKHGSASLYVKDVNTLLKDNCRCLYEAASIAPNAKWIIVGGSPCQDLTFAGPFRGLLGLVGKNSRLFFVLLGVIRAMQDLATTNNVRFNGGRSLPSLLQVARHPIGTKKRLSLGPSRLWIWHHTKAEFLQCPHGSSIYTGEPTTPS